MDSFDFRDGIIHSAKGSTWKKHKYIKKVNGRYIYSNSGAVKSTGARAAAETVGLSNLHKNFENTDGEYVLRGLSDRYKKRIGKSKSVKSNLKSSFLNVGYLMSVDPKAASEEARHIIDSKAINTSDVKYMITDVIDAVKNKKNKR